MAKNIVIVKITIYNKIRLFTVSSETNLTPLI